MLNTNGFVIAGWCTNLGVGYEGGVPVTQWREGQAQLCLSIALTKRERARKRHLRLQSTLAKNHITVPFHISHGTPCMYFSFFKDSFFRQKGPRPQTLTFTRTHIHTLFNSDHVSKMAVIVKVKLRRWIWTPQ